MVGSAGEGTVDWPEAPVFFYTGIAARAPLIVVVGLVGSGLFPLLIGGVGVLAAIMPEVLPVSMAHPSSLASFIAAARAGRGMFIISSALASLGLLEALAGVWIALWIGRLRPALAVSAAGIFAFRGGKPWRSLAWADVISIVKLRSRGPKTGQGVITVRIAAPGVRLELTSQINGYAEACGLLTRHARAQGIKLLDTTEGAAVEIAAL
jgi:hypothetical protein